MRLLPGSGSASDQANEALELNLIKAPCLVEISYGGKGAKCYIIRMRVISEQLPRDQNGDIVVPHPTNE